MSGSFFRTLNENSSLISNSRNTNCKFNLHLIETSFEIKRHTIYNYLQLKRLIPVFTSKCKKKKQKM